jgi:hypothetical protein
MNVILMIDEILGVANPVIGESALPDFSVAAKNFAKSVGVSALDELDCMFEGNVEAGSKQEMDMLRHQNEGVQLIATVAAISVHGS